MILFLFTAFSPCYFHDKDFYQYHLFFSFKISLVILSVISSSFSWIFLCRLKILKKKTKNIRYIKYIIHTHKLVLKFFKKGMIYIAGIYIIANIIHIRLKNFTVIKITRNYGKNYNFLHVQFHRHLNKLKEYYTEHLVNDYQYQYKLVTKKMEL